jgi:phosphoribosyl-ATP pyrophosphohydrolase
MADSIDRLYQAVLSARTRDPAYSRTAKLIREGMAKMAKKLAEEAVEVGLDAVQGNREAVIRESADLIYNLVVVLVEAGITPDEVWREMDRREQLYGIAEKLAKNAPLDDGLPKPIAKPLAKPAPKRVVASGR